jgi:hypothetical protein
MRKITKRSAAVITAAVVAVGGGSAAWAYWTFGGTGNAAVAAGTAVRLNVHDLVVEGPLVPGMRADVTFTVDNSNKFPVVITGISYGNRASSPLAGCAGQIEQVTGASLPGSRDIPAESSRTYTFNDSLKLIDNPETACQGQSYTFDVVLAATSDTSAPANS